jgi:MscS family membrane protein
MKKVTLLFLVLGVMLTSTVWAQNDFSTPRKAFESFYENLNKENPDVGTASKIISSRHVFSKRKREQLALDLKAYIDSNNLAFNLDSIPDETNYKDSITQRNAFPVMQYVVLEKISNHWYLSKESVSSIPDLVIDPEPEEETEQKGILAERQKARREREKQLEQIAAMPVDLSTPYATVKFFMDNIDKDPAVAARIISNKDVAHLNARIEIAEKLTRFLDGKGVIVDIDQVPEDPDFTDSTHVGRYTYELTYRFSDIYLERDGSRWYLSKETAEKVPSLYKQAFPFGSDRLLKYIPTEGRIEFFGLYAWQYIAILVLITLTYLVFRLLNWSITFLVTRILFRFGYKELARTYVMPVVRPIGLLIAFMMAETALPFLQLPIKVNAFAAVAVEILIPIFATIAFYYSTDLLGLYLKKIASKTENTFDDQLVPLITKILKTFVIVIGFVFVLQRMGTDIKLLLGTLSVGGLALALAAQDTIKNFFGSLMIFMDKPFQAGHWVVSTDGIDGIVEEVGFRSTRIRTFENSVITVPNGKLSDASINNYGLRSFRRFKTHIAVTYDTPPDLLNLFIDGLREIVEKHPKTRKDVYHVYMNDMGSHSLNILFYIFFVTPEWAEELKYRHEIIISIMKLADELGINFAFPTQTLHMENFPGQESLSPVYQSPEQLEPKMKKFLSGQFKKEEDEK